MPDQLLIPKPGSKIDLSAFDPGYDDGIERDKAEKKTEKYLDRMADLQERLYAEGKQSLLVVLQAMDAGGKDGTIKKVFDRVNPLGLKIAAFKAPSAEELAHDFLWRVHRQTPPKGYIGIFNRSHYEDVLIVRVNKLVPEAVWKARYDHINAFERLLTGSGTRVLKFFLHISREEQKERFTERLTEPDKQWKFSMGDLPVREQWPDYMRAYEDAIGQCNTDYAPWHIVPADKKWYRNLVIARTIVETLEDMNPQYPQPEAGLDKVVIPD